MPRKTCYWTRKLELDLVEYVRTREFIWRPFGNTNHHIQQKYKAYAEFAAKLGRGFTARSVRDRWVNIRSTFNHNLRRVDKSKETAQSPAEVYVPCWPLWKPLQFLRETSKRDEMPPYQAYTMQSDSKIDTSCMDVKEELLSDMNNIDNLKIRQRGTRTDRPRRRINYQPISNSTEKCKGVLDDIIMAMAPITSSVETTCTGNQQYWFFGRHVTERLNSMRSIDAECASRDILEILNSCSDTMNVEINN